MKLNRKGQTLVEYVLIISLITVVAIGLVKIFGGYLQDAVTKMGCNISGKEYKEGGKGGGLLVGVYRYWRNKPVTHYIRHMCLSLSNK